MRKLILILAQILLAGIAAGQTSIYMQPISSGSDSQIATRLRNSVGDQYNNTWNIGSAKKLDDSIYILEVWLTASGTKWKYQDMQHIQYKINEATDWIVETARRYGKQISIKSGTFAGNRYEGIQMDNLPKSYAEAASMQQLLPNALRIIGYRDIMHCYNALRELSGCGNVITLVIINNGGWSCSNNFSVGHIENGFQNYFLENAYIFRSNNGKDVSSQTIAHEILHLFGAWDMYEGQVSQEADKWARSHYPNEIMLQTSSPLSKLDISPLTAWLTGLSTQYHDWYMKFLRSSQPYVKE